LKFKVINNDSSDSFRIIDNVLNESFLSLVKDTIESWNFPWYFLSNSSVPVKKMVNEGLNYSFHHTALDADGKNSNFYDMSNMMALVMKDSFKLDHYKIVRLRWGMTMSIDKVYRNDPHVDSKNPHKVILFYLQNSDGETYFYNDSNEVIDSVTPKENRAVLFDGSLLHSSSKPVNFARRIVLNINLSINED
tara:strand:+ start:3335 stop:3910 length:576 start_codon:yes stop_codon:yes gene_type:complete